jgi:hypothetical protein
MTKTEKHSETGSNRFSFSLAILEQTGNVRAHAQRDVAAIYFGKARQDDLFEFAPGIIEEEKTTSGLLTVSSSSTKSFGQVLTGNDVFLFGYPNSLGLKNIPQLDYSRPLLRKGIIAGKHETLRHLILDCPVYPGNSGGPVIEVEQKGLQWHYATIGIVSQFVPVVETWENTVHRYTNIELGNSGYSVATPIEYALELIDGMG